MIEIKSDRDIRIDLDVGVYMFDNESATGKTFLYKMLNNLVSRKDIVCLTYSTSKYISNLYDIVSDKTKLILLDRYDMYSEKYQDTIREYSNKAVILLDCKVFAQLNDIAQMCFIELSETRLEVRSYDSI